MSSKILLGLQLMAASALRLDTMAESFGIGGSHEVANATLIQEAVHSHD